MKLSSVLVLTVASVVVAGCSSVSGLLGGNDRASSTAQPQIAVNNELAMPPDLSLATPGTRAAPANNGLAADDGLYSEDTPPAAAKKVATAPAAQAPTQDIYEQYGISKLNPDGTKKDEGKLREELRQAILAKKRQQNPNHGTVFNIGNLFKD